MKTFSALVLKYRFAILVLTIGLTLFFGYGVTKVTINSDMLSYLKPDDPLIQVFNRIGDDYGGNTMAMVAIEGDDIFTTETLTVIKDLTEAYSQIQGVSSVLSLTNILDMKKIEGGLEVRKLIDKYDIPQTEEELERLKAYTLGKEMYAGKFISLDGKITLLVARLLPEAGKEDIAEQIKTITEEHKGSYTVYYSGMPLQMLEINQLLVNDMRYLIPIVILVVMATLYYSFRSLRGVVLPLLNVVFATLWAVGLMGWLNIEMSIISNIMPVILIAVGSAYGIHFLSKYYEDFRPEMTKHEMIAEALQEVGIPIILTGLTTLIGFISFARSYLTAITHFGLFSAFGVAVAMLLAVTFIPATLSFLSPPGSVSRDVRQEKHFLIHIMDRVGTVVLNHEKLILAVGLCIILLSITGIPRITTEANMIEFFQEDSQIQISDKLMREKFGGSTPIQMLMTGDLKDPFVLKEMLRLEKYMESLPDVNNTQSLADLICEMNNVMNGHYTVPETTEQIANLLFLLEGDEMLDQLVNKDYSEGIVQARFATFNTEKTQKVVDAMNAYLETELTTRMQVTPVADLTPPERNALREFQLDRISEAILYDAAERMSEVQLDEALLSSLLRQFSAVDFVPLSELHQDTLRDRVELFFWEEADVMLDDDEEIAEVVDAVVELTADQAVSEKNLMALLKHVIPPEYWEDDPDTLNYTGEFLLPIVQERQNFNRIDEFVGSLLPIFPSELQENQKFREDLRDDLWVLNEQIVGIPATLNIAPNGREVTLSSEQSGMMIVLNEICASLVNSQVRSVFWALLLVAILLTIQFKSMKLGLVITSPIVLTVMTNFAVMGYAGVPLDVATVMIAGVAIGIGIDYAIHFSSRLRFELTRQPDTLFALDKTLETSGRAILVNALTVALGFIILLGSKIIAIQRFGWLLAMTMGVSACSALSFLPALILVLRKFLFKGRQYARFTAPFYYRQISASSEPKLLINISLGGFRIYRDEQLKSGEHLDIELLLPDEHTLACTARVIWQRSLPSGSDAQYDVGLRIVNLTENDIDQLSQVLKQYAEPVAT